MNAVLARRWLQTLAILHISVGILLPFLTNTRLFDWYHIHLLEAFGTTNTSARHMGEFMVGVLGPTVASWGLLFLFMVGHAYEQGSIRAWRYMVLTVTGWSVYDMVYSILYGVMLNVLIDLVVMSLLLIPLLASRGHFTRRPLPDSL